MCNVSNRDTEISSVAPLLLPSILEVDGEISDEEHPKSPDTPDAKEATAEERFAVEEESNKGNEFFSHPRATLLPPAILEMHDEVPDDEHPKSPDTPDAKALSESLRELSDDQRSLDCQAVGLKSCITKTRSRISYAMMARLAIALDEARQQPGHILVHQNYSR